MWEIYSITDIIRDNAYGKSPLIDIEITYRPGLWFEKFAEEAAANEKKSVAFGKQIRKARKANGESLRTMAKQLNISSSRLSQIENGCYPHPVNSTLKNKLLAHLGLDR